MFYNELRTHGFRAHHVKQIYVYAKAVVKACKRNNGRKPVLRKLTARLDKYDYKLNLDDRTLILKIHGGRKAKLRLLTSTERVEKFRSWSNYEITVEVVEDKVYVSIYFRKTVKSRKTRTVMTIDVNFDNVTLVVFTSSGELLKLKRYRTPLRRMLTHRIWIERIRRKYSKSWRFIRSVRKAIKKHGERIRNIAWDYAHKIGDSIAELASRYSSIVVLEDLSHLRDRVNGSSSFNKKLSLWFYRRIQFTIEYEAVERSLKVMFVNPMKTSSTCSRCGNKFRYNGGRTLQCPKCKFISDRDVVACINLFLKILKMWGAWGHPERP